MSQNDASTHDIIIIIIIILVGRYIPEEGKKLMKKIGVWSSTNPGDQKTKKPSCKSTALKRWVATEMR